MKKLLIALVIATSSAAQASDAVKIVSAPCADAAKARVGSGLRFQREGHAYVLTSQAAVYHSSESRFCHTVTMDGAQVSARLLAADWGLGVALLELPGVKPAATWPDRKREVTWPTGVSEGVPVTIEGYPRAASAPVTDGRGAILVSWSERHLFPMPGGSIELDGAHVESGMIGAPVRLASDYEKGHLFGIVSHQYLKMVPGRATRAYDWDAVADHIETQVIVVPLRSFDDWIDAVASKPEAFRQDFRVLADDQLAGVPRVIAGAIAFEELCPAPGNSDGHDPEYPIGGADGVGIGGDSVSDKACKLKLTVAPKGTETVFPFTEYQDWAEQARAVLAQGASGEVDFLYGGDGRGVLERVSFRSVSEFMRRLVKPDMASTRYAIMDIATAAGAQEPGLDPKLAPMRKLAGEAARLAVKLYVDHGIGDENAMTLMRRIYLVSRLLQSEQQKDVALSDLDPLLDRESDYKFAWNWFTWAPNGGQPLYDDLVALRAELEKVRKQ